MQQQEWLGNYCWMTEEDETGEKALTFDICWSCNRNERCSTSPHRTYDFAKSPSEWRRLKKPTASVAEEALSALWNVIQFKFPRYQYHGASSYSILSLLVRRRPFLIMTQGEVAS